MLISVHSTADTETTTKKWKTEKLKIKKNGYAQKCDDYNELLTRSDVSTGERQGKQGGTVKRAFFHSVCEMFLIMHLEIIFFAK